MAKIPRRKIIKYILIFVLWLCLMGFAIWVNLANF